MTDQEIQDVAEAKLLEMLRKWYVQSTTILNQLAGLPLSSATSQAMSDLISGFHDLQPDYLSIKENFLAERDAMAEALRNPRSD